MSDEHKIPVMWSDNHLGVVLDCRARIRGKLQAALEHLDYGQDALFLEAINSINSYIVNIKNAIEYNNLKDQRIHKLIQEIKAYRSGTAITWPTGQDPAAEDYKP